MKHLVITGHKNCGKTTFVEKILENYKGNVLGFSTRIMNKKEDDFREIYILKAKDLYGKDAIVKRIDFDKYGIKKDLTSGEMYYPDEIKAMFNLSDKNHMADCDSVKHIVYTNVFENEGVMLLKEALNMSKVDSNNTLIIMDEIGFMENDATEFKKCVLEILDSEYNVLATLRKKGSTEFMEMVRNHPNVDLIEITLDNRDELISKYKDIF